jgi:hypothetical protein
VNHVTPLRPRVGQNGLTFNGLEGLAMNIRDRVVKLTVCPTCKGARRYSPRMLALVHVSRNRAKVCRRIKELAAARAAKKAKPDAN